jgi:SAM-dependent methyltransferase
MVIGVLLGLAALHWSLPSAAEAQPARRPYRIGVLNEAWAANHPTLEGLKAGLRDLGVEEGRDVTFDIRFTEGKPEATSLAAADLVRAGVDLIFTSNTYHHFDNRIVYFANLRKFVKPAGRIAIVDYDRRAWLEGLLRHYTPAEFIKREMEQAGYRLQQELTFLDRQSFLIFTPAR